MSTHFANLAPRGPETKLKEAKDHFKQAMLANDTFFAALQAKLEIGDGVNKANLPEFSCEPTLKKQNDGITMGVRLASSRTEGDMGLSLSLSAFDYIDIGEADSPTGQAHAAPALLDLLKIAGVQEPELAAQSIGETWRDGFNSLARQFRGQATIDSQSHTIELISEIERTVYSSE